MKYVVTLIAVVAVLLVAMPAQATTINVGDQILINGGFETTTSGTLPDHWVRFGGMDAMTNANAHSGSKFLACYYNGRGAQDNWDPVGEVFHYDGISSNVTGFKVEGWIRGETSGGIGRITLETFLSDDYSHYNADIVESDGTTEWKQYSVTVPFETGANWYSVTLKSMDYDNTTYFDDMTLTAVPEPSIMVLTMVGLVGLLAYAWRKRK